MKVIFVFVFLCTSVSLAGPEVQTPQGVYKPIFRELGESDTNIPALTVDQTPVTNKDFLEFIKQFPQYKKSTIKALFIDPGYLSHWNDDDSYSKKMHDFPITNVSWFVARKYCQSKNKRLPTIAEWEYLCDAQNPKYESEILKWYSKPGSNLRSVGQNTSNKFGLKDCHGHIWEWVDNFSETIMSGDSRGGSSTDNMFCGGSALKAKDPKLYAAFMRFAFRSSLTARYTSNILGFRCVKDKE